MIRGRSSSSHIRHVVVFDAADLAESSFWAGMFGGRVFADDRIHSVVDGDGEWGLSVCSSHQIPPDWPDGNAQRVHIDLHVDDHRAAHARGMGLGARLLAAGDLEADEGHQV